MLAKLVFRGEIAVQNERESQNSDKDVQTEHESQHSDKQKVESK